MRTIFKIFICSLFILVLNNPCTAQNEFFLQKVHDYWPTHGWKTSSPQECGVKSEYLLDLDQYILAKLPHIHSFLIIRHGYIIFEKYYQNWNKNKAHNLKSVTKSFTSALIGIAIQKGFLRTIDQNIKEFFPEYINSTNDSIFGGINIRHLLTMSSGLGKEKYYDWLQCKNMTKYAFNLPLANEPGSKFQYNNATCHLLSVILTKATKMSTLHFADKYLFKPLGIQNRRWDTDPQGYNIGSNCLYLTSRDAAKFGYLFLNVGEWSGQQIIPKIYVIESTKRQIGVGFPERSYYGYLWWIPKKRGTRSFFASGHGGQYIYVIPKLDMVIVITSDIKHRHRGENKALIYKFIFPSIKS